MGNWTVVIHGVGPHDNGKPYDVEQMGCNFRDALEKAGHSIIDANVTIGSAKSLQIEHRGSMRPMIPETLAEEPKPAPAPELAPETVGTGD